MTSEGRTILGRFKSLVSRRLALHRVVLFGSRARGDAAPDSDADLLVVMRVRGSRRRQAARMDAALAGVGLPKDIIIVTPAEFERQRHIVGGIVYPAVREGRVLYDVAG